MEGGEGEKGIGTPVAVCARVCASDGASDIVYASVTVCVVVDPLVAQTVTESTMVVSLPPVVAIAVNPVTQDSNERAECSCVP
jgi:hypothetical protein